MSKPKTTSWGAHADWYGDVVEAKGNYQSELILPNLTRLMTIQKGDRVLDLACGTGFFARAWHAQGAQVTGVDIGSPLIAKAKKESPNDIIYHVAAADKLPFLKDGSTTKISLVLAIQNIENVTDVLQECRRVLTPTGALFIVMTHPAFRIPQGSAWGWDEETKTQYRRIDQYLSESKTNIQMHPGENPKETTPTFHRPLQFYAKALQKARLRIARIEEWESHRTSQAGPRAKAENTARKEIPLFMMIEAFG